MKEGIVKEGITTSRQCFLFSLPKTTYVQGDRPENRFGVDTFVFDHPMRKLTPYDTQVLVHMSGASATASSIAACCACW